MTMMGRNKTLASYVLGYYRIGISVCTYATSVINGSVC
jgi:hypothetical protein